MKKISRFLVICVLFFSLWRSVFPLDPTANRFVELEITGPVNEKRALYEFIFPRFRTLKQYMDLLDKAERDPEVGGLILKIGNPELGWAKLHQLRRSIHNFRKSGKSVYALLEGEGIGPFLLACSCDEISIIPSSSLMIAGPRLEAYFFKDLLGRLGIMVDVVAVGRYKNAAEPFTEQSMTPETREMLTSLLDDFYEQTIRILVQDRGMTTDTARMILDEGLFTPPEAQKRGLVDHLDYEKQLHDRIDSKLKRYLNVVKDYGKPEKPAPEFNILTLFFQTKSREKPRARQRKIAYIVATGTILPGEREDYPFQEHIIAAKDLVEQIQSCVDDPDIMALILRIDSPGGSVLASDLIWRAVRDAKKEKPVVASLSNVAASGGYYIAMGADRIIAEPGTLTGSIGVISGKPVLEDLFEKIGINVEVISRGKNSGLFSPNAPFTESQREALYKISMYAYHNFVDKVAGSRGMSRDSVLAAAEGRVWTGRQALAINLVDELGGIETAINEAKKLAGISPSRYIEVEVYPRQLGLFEFFQEMMSGGQGAGVSSLSGGVSLPGLSEYEPHDMAPLLEVLDSSLGLSGMGKASLFYLFQKERILYLSPFHIEIR